LLTPMLNGPLLVLLPAVGVELLPHPVSAIPAAAAKASTARVLSLMTILLDWRFLARGCYGRWKHTLR
jgi:hypothetical protein